MHRNTRRPGNAARERLRDHRHSQLVCARFDCNAVFQMLLLHDGLQRVHVLHMQPDRTRIILAEDERIDRALLRQCDRTLVAREVTRARIDVRLKCLFTRELPQMLRALHL